MRTTVTFDDDTRAAIDRLRRESSVGLSHAVNTLIRAGLAREQERRPFKQRSQGLALRIDVTNIGEALEELDVPAGRWPGSIGAGDDAALSGRDSEDWLRDN